MDNIFFAERADGVVKFAKTKSSRKNQPPDLRCILCSCAELEELIADIRLFMQHARTDGDAFEYYRLCEELKLAEAALRRLCHQSLRS